MGRRLVTPAHLRDRAGADARESGEDRAENKRLGASDDGEPGPDQGDVGADDDRRCGTTANGDAGTRTHDRAAARG